jgi:hypothetical protein
LLVICKTFQKQLIQYPKCRFNNLVPKAMMSRQIKAIKAHENRSVQFRANVTLLYNNVDSAYMNYSNHLKCPEVQRKLIP